MSRLLALAGQLLRRFAGPLIVVLTVLLAALVAGGLVWNGWRDAGAQARAREAARQRAGVEIARASDQSSRAALEAMAGQGQRDMDRQVREQETRDDILSAPDAGASAGAAGDVGLAGLCRRAVYRDHPRCAGLRGTDPAPAAR
ncbi:hypothetical protein [Caulobacter sp. NIBR1757]|uniref:hypothetical protein n=1 Tax=Caulobacter sp. NIBR1757 TaxID=3016000 RepID=UPI0022F114F7|nr:hypothetical protein [Caulobacter sp. NIBR1757]